MKCILSRKELLILLALTGVVHAHHSVSGQFNADKTLVSDAILKKVEWINPHPYMTFEITQPDGKSEVWLMESAAPAALRRAGLSGRDALKIGEKYTVFYHPSWSGKPVGLINVFSLPDGQLIGAGTEKSLQDARRIMAERGKPANPLTLVHFIDALIQKGTTMIAPFCLRALVALHSITTACLAISSVMAATVAASVDEPTPRLVNGRPDLSGYWNQEGTAGLGLTQMSDEEVLYAVIRARDGRLQNFENDSYIAQKSAQNIPLYKPEYWSKVRELDHHGNREDPTFNCLPAGVPRVGPPIRVVALPNEVILFHMSTNPAISMFRIIPIGKPRNPNDLLIETWNGIPEARWEGDTLVIDSIGFNDQSWLGWGGFFHSFDMRVTERLQRQSNVLYYEALVEDPTVLLQPYRPGRFRLTLSTHPDVTIRESEPCIERDLKDLVNDTRG